MVFNRAKFIALVAGLGAIAAVTRIPFAIIPNLQPTTFFIIVSGWVLGPSIGLSVGMLAAVVSNFFLGHGPWTLFQMLAWGLAGSMSGFLGKLIINPSKIFLSLYGFIWGYLYGWILNLWFWLTMIYPHTWKSFFASAITSFWFDTTHAIGNALFLILGGKIMMEVLERFRLKLTVKYEKESDENNE